jgi:hypothetical protein
MMINLQHQRQALVAGHGRVLLGRGLKTALHARTRVAGAQRVERRQRVGEQRQLGGLLFVDGAVEALCALFEPLANY